LARVKSKGRPLPPAYTDFQMYEDGLPPQNTAGHRGDLMISLCSAAPSVAIHPGENYCKRSGVHLVPKNCARTQGKATIFAQQGSWHLPFINSFWTKKYYTDLTENY
jgi:hypothetical protein